MSASGFAADANLLLEWVSKFAASSQADSVRGVANWLQNNATPDDWHRATTDLNWGYGTHPLLWIARQPRCERATALMIFYLARPGQMLEYADIRDDIPGWRRGAFDLVSEVRRRFLEGFYTTATIAFDASHAFNNEAYLPEDWSEDTVSLVIPDIMRTSIAGRILSPKYDFQPQEWL